MAQQQQQTREERMTTYGKLLPCEWETPIHSELGEKMDVLIIEWTCDNYNVLVDMLDGYQGENNPNHTNYLPENERIKPYELSIELSEFLSNGLFEAGFYKPGTSLHSHIKKSNIVGDYLEHVDIYICNCAEIADLEELNVDIHNEDQMIEEFLFYYLLQRHVMVNEFIEIRDNQIIMK